MKQRTKGFTTLGTIALGFSFLAILGLADYVYKNPKLGAVVLSTDLTNTINTFRTNVNSSLTSLNNELETVSSTIAGYGNIVTLNTPLTVNKGGTGTTTLPTTGQLLIGNGTDYFLGTINASGTNTHIYNTVAGFSISADPTDLANTYAWTGVHSFATTTSFLNQNTFNLQLNSQARGDLLYAASSTAWTRFASSTSGLFLRASSTGGAPYTWGGLAYISNVTSTSGATDTTPSTVATAIIPAGMMPAHHGIRITAGVTVNTRNVSFVTYFGGVVITSSTLISSGSTGDARVVVDILNTANTSIQTEGVQITGSRDVTGGEDVDFFTSAIDTTIPLTFSITLMNQGGTSSQAPVLRYYYIEPI